MTSILRVPSDPLPPGPASLWAAPPDGSGNTADWSQCTLFQPKSPLAMWTDLLLRDRSGAPPEKSSSMESDATALLDLETLMEEASADSSALGPKVLDVLHADPPVDREGTAAAMAALTAMSAAQKEGNAGAEWAKEPGLKATATPSKTSQLRATAPPFVSNLRANAPRFVPQSAQNPAKATPTAPPLCPPATATPMAPPLYLLATAPPTAPPLQLPATAPPTAPPLQLPVTAPPTAQPLQLPATATPTAQPLRTPATEVMMKVSAADEHLGSAPAPERKKEIPICLAWVRGTCSGDSSNCGFPHPTLPFRLLPGHTILQTLKAMYRFSLEDDDMCDVWIVTGSCPLGNKCRATHPRLPPWNMAHLFTLGTDSATPPGLEPPPYAVPPHAPQPKTSRAADLPAYATPPALPAYARPPPPALHSHAVLR